MKKKPLDYQARTQHGDPVPDERTLSAEALAGHIPVKPMTTGPIASTRICGNCRAVVNDGPCPICAGIVKPSIGGVNVERPPEPREDLPWMRPIRGGK